jgi:prohibitin 1
MALLALGLVVGGLLFLLSFGIPGAGSLLEDTKTRQRSRARVGLRLAGLGAALAGVVVATFRVVPGGYVGVQILFGRIYEQVLSEGLNAISPLKHVLLMSIRTQELFEHAEVPSKEGLTVGLEVSALYHLDATTAPAVLRTLGEDYERVFMVPQFRSVIRGATVNHEAKDLYTSGREVIAEQIYHALHTMLGERGIVLEKVLLRKIVLPKMVEEAINSKLAAEQEAERMRFVLQKETQEAERKRVEASGIADFQRIVSQGISEPLLKWKAIEVAHDISNSPNTKVVILGDKSGLPIILGDK